MSEQTLFCNVNYFSRISGEEKTLHIKKPKDRR